MNLILNRTNYRLLHTYLFSSVGHKIENNLQLSVRGVERFTNIAILR